MSVLAFFPWFSVDEVIELPGFKLVPYQRGKLPFETEPHKQELADKILGSYKTRSFSHGADHPVSKAAILQAGDDIIQNSISDDIISNLFMFAELVAFSGMAQREYFSHFNYCNRSKYRLVVQKFEGDSGWTSAESRRRDGSASNLASREDMIIHKPDHVAVTLHDAIPNWELLKGLLNSMQESVWESVYSSIVYFNLANTDSPEFTPHIEAILMVSSMEQVVGSNTGKEKDLVMGMNQLIDPFGVLPIHESGRLTPALIKSNFSGCQSVEEVWLRDFFRMRNNYAHGNIYAPRRNNWNASEHLLLGSLIFPVMVKIKLKQIGNYELTNDDKVMLNAFPLLINEGFQPEVDLDGDELKWQTIITTEKINLARSEMLKTFETGDD